MQSLWICFGRDGAHTCERGSHALRARLERYGQNHLVKTKKAKRCGICGFVLDGMAPTLVSAGRTLRVLASNSMVKAIS